MSGLISIANEIDKISMPARKAVKKISKNIVKKRSKKIKM
jgi:hypothetical protein